MPEYAPPSPFEFYRILVPTMDSVLYTWLLGKMSRVGNPTLFVGESGTAKTVTIQNYLNSLDPEKSLVLNVNFSSRTSSMDVQTNIEVRGDDRRCRTMHLNTGLETFRGAASWLCRRTLTSGLVERTVRRSARS